MCLTGILTNQPPNTTIDEMGLFELYLVIIWIIWLVNQGR